MSIILGLRRLRKEGCVAYLGYTVRSYAPPPKTLTFLALRSFKLLFQLLIIYVINCCQLQSRYCAIEHQILFLLYIQFWYPLSSLPLFQTLCDQHSTFCSHRISINFVESTQLCLTFPNDPCPNTFKSSNWEGSAFSCPSFT